MQLAGCKSTLKISSETGVVVLAISLFKSLQVKKTLWIAFVKGWRLLSIREISHVSGPYSVTLPFFVRSSDVIRSLLGHEKGKAVNMTDVEIN